MVHRNGIMAQPTRYVIWTTLAIMLLLACIFAGCTSNQSTPQAPVVTQSPQSEPNSVTIEKFAFNPETLTIKPGTTVTWKNRDAVDHTIIAESGSTIQFRSKELGSGDSYSFTFSEPGTYPYYCSIHPSMRGTIVVQS